MTLVAQGEVMGSSYAAAVFLASHGIKKARGHVGRKSSELDTAMRSQLATTASSHDILVASNLVGLSTHMLCTQRCM
jgi:hypothetical protein